MRSDDRQESGGFGSRAQAFKLNFLGHEFLTWLYFYIETEGSEVTLTSPTAANGKGIDGEKIRLSIGTKMTLKSLFSNDVRVSVTSPTLDDSGEVFQSLRAGSLVDSLCLDIGLGERKHSLTLNAGDGSLSQIKSQYAFEERDREEGLTFLNEDNEQNPKDRQLRTDETIIIRMSALDEIEDIIDALFYRFLSRRLAQAFVTQDISNIRSTIAEKLAEKLPKFARSVASEEMQVSAT